MKDPNLNGALNASEAEALSPRNLDLLGRRQSRSRRMERTKILPDPSWSFGSSTTKCFGASRSHQNRNAAHRIIPFDGTVGRAWPYFLKCDCSPRNALSANWQSCRQTTFQNCGIGFSSCYKKRNPSLRRGISEAEALIRHHTPCRNLVKAGGIGSQRQSLARRPHIDGE